MSTSQPFFCVVLHDSDKWVIEAEWPDGSIEPIDTFSEHFEALNWITNQAAAWTEQPLLAIPKWRPVSAL
jgi:hypothetical protein